MMIDEMLADLVASGEFLTDACAALGLGVRDVYRRLSKEPEFAKLMDEARDSGADARAARTAKVMRGEAGHSTGDWKRDQAICKQENWLLEKWHPKRYGAKAELNVTSLTATTAISDDPVEAAKQYDELMRR